MSSFVVVGLFLAKFYFPYILEYDVAFLLFRVEFSILEY